MRTLKTVICSVAVGAMAFAASAQNTPPKPKEGAPPAPAAPANRQPRPDGAGPQRPQALSPEKAKAAWELQATGVSKRLGVKAEQTTAVVKAYSEARTTHDAAADKLREDLMKKARDAGGDDNQRPGRGGMGPEAMKAMEDLNKADRGKLEKTLGSTLTPEQTTKAVASLGTFNRQWDTMADAVAGFKLEAGKQQTALDAIEDFVVAQAKARGGGPDADREAMRTAMQESRTKLTDAMKKVLTAEQFTKFQESMRGGGRPGGGRGPDGGGPGPGPGGGGG
jgi:hypothetical protein